MSKLAARGFRPTYEDTVLENEDLKKMVESLQKEVESLQKENQNLKHTISCLTSSKNQMTFSNEKHHKKVARHFKDLFQKTFYDLPDSVPDHSKNEVWVFFLKVFEKAYSQCQTVVLETFQKNIRSLTELQKEESKSGRCRESLEESLALFQEAYSLLLEGSGLDKTNEPPDHGEMEKQLTAEVQKLLPRAPHTIIESKVSAAIRVAWEMLTLSPPAISCTPEKYTETWHEVFRKEWDNDYKYYDLVYYRPVMLHGAGGTAAVRGLVGNTRSTDSANCVNEGEGSFSESDVDTDLLLCTSNQEAEEYKTQGNHIESELCHERAIAKSSICNPLFSQGEHHVEQVDTSGICGKPITYTVNKPDVVRDENDVPDQDVHETLPDHDDTSGTEGAIRESRSYEFNAGEGTSSESDNDTDLPLCTSNQEKESKNTQKPVLCSESAITKSPISTPLLSQEHVHKTLLDCDDTSVTTKEEHHREKVDICGICGRPITYTEKDVFIDENGVPFHFKCVVLCPVCKQVILYRETSRKAPTGEYWCEKCFDGHWICCVCNKQLSEAETGSQLPCCGKKWRHETCQHGHDYSHLHMETSV